jgi:hypothetical protein
VAAQRSKLWLRGFQKVKANQSRMPDAWLVQPALRALQKITLAFFVQCNILPFMRAVELRKVQADKTKPTGPAQSGGTEKANVQELR